MAEIIVMPRMSDTMEEGTIVDWHKKVGDKVAPGDLLAEIETDKATMELESFWEGTLLYIGVDKGAVVPVDRVIAVIGEEGEDYKAQLEEVEKKAAADQPNPSEGNGAPPDEIKEAAVQDTPSTTISSPPPPPPPQASVAAPAIAVAAPPVTTGSGRVKSSPLAKRLALEAGIEISQIPGTGDDGRIIKRDVEQFVLNPAAAAATHKARPALEFVTEESYEEVGLSQMRKTIAKRLSESKFTSPHFYLTMEIEMSKAIEARKSINELSPTKISFNDMIIKAAALGLRSNPKANSSWLGDRIRFNKHIHIGMAVAVDEGLVVPVIRFAETLKLEEISAQARSLAAKARDRSLQHNDMEGNTFSISNLGMFDIDEFTAIINPHDACILAVGKIKETPVVKDGQIVPGNLMKVTLSCDHRVVDGAIGSQFLQSFKEYLEDPVKLMYYN